MLSSSNRLNKKIKTPALISISKRNRQGNPHYSCATLKERKHGKVKIWY
jgi:hypothetical protein